MKNNKAATVGCLFGILRIIIITPMWFYLLYQILIRMEMPPLVWYIFWTYLPVTMVLAIVGTIIEVVVKSES